jgi:dihydrofolate reductase
VSSRLSIVVAASRNGVIGRDNQLPWRLPADLQRFKALTLGKPVLMGRKTYDSIGKPLPGRLNIVISRRAGLHIAGCTVVDSVAAALVAAEPAEEVMIIGGAEIFRATLPHVSTIHLTRVQADIAGDVVFPQLEPSEWRERELEYHPADERHSYAFSFIELTRK